VDLVHDGTTRTHREAQREENGGEGAAGGTDGHAVAHGGACVIQQKSAARRAHHTRHDGYQPEELVDRQLPMEVILRRAQAPQSPLPFVGSHEAMARVESGHNQQQHCIFLFGWVASGAGTMRVPSGG
jgi:hypothetical protein